MRILVNYDKKDQSHLPILQYHLRGHNLQAIATNLTLTAGELVDKAKSTGCSGILLCNEGTLQQCVPGVAPTLDLYRGSLLNFSVPTIVCNSLLHTTTVDHGAWLLGKDLDKFKTLKDCYKVPFDFTVLTDALLMNQAFEELKQAECISYDIETKTLNEDEETLRGGDTIITCASYTGIFPGRILKTFVLPFVDFLEDHWKTDAEYAEAIQCLRKINALDIPKVMHNGMYDCLHSIVYRAFPNHWTLDTMAMMHSEFASLPKSLDFVASIALPDYLQWKVEAEAASKAKDINAYWTYNAKDTWNTARILLYYLDKMPAYARKNYSMQFPLVYPCLYGNMEGLLIDQEERTKLRNEAVRVQDESLKTLQTMLADPNFNPGSYKQIQAYVYDVFGAADPHIGKKKDAKTGRRTTMVRGTDEKNLRAIGEQHPLLTRLTDSIIDYRGAQKAIGTYFDFYQRNGRLLWSLNPFGTDSGRMACQASSFWCGTQVQNVPYYAKGMLVADEGYTLIELDNSQSEARCTGYLAKEWDLIAALENPLQDFYTSLGTLFFGIPYPEVTKELRNSVLKKIVHGTNYMMGAATFVENTGVQKLIDGAALLGVKITLDKKIPEGYMSIKQFASYLLDAYHNPFPRVRMWYKEIAAEVASTHMLVSPLGHTRYFFGDITKDHNMLRGAVAHAPQNLSVSILNIGLMRIWKLVKASKGLVRFKAQIHDSVFLQIHNSILTQTIPQLQQCLYNPVAVNGRNLVIPVDYKIGMSWGHMEEVKTPRG